MSTWQGAWRGFRMEAFRELGLYGERRRGQPSVDISDIFPGVYEILNRSYRPEGDSRQYSIEVYLTQMEPVAVITVEHTSNVMDGFTTMHMKVVSTEPEKVVEQIKIKAPYLENYEFPLPPVAAS